MRKRLYVLRAHIGFLGHSKQMLIFSNHICRKHAGSVIVKVYRITVRNTCRYNIHSELNDKHGSRCCCHV